jgi:hypothetical protein
MLNTTSHRTAIAAALAVAASTALATVAGAQPAAATPAAKVTGAYLYIQKIEYSGGQRASRQPFATLVFRTDRQLPRRFDGLIRAGAGVAGQNGSVGSVHGKASRCYTVNARIKPDNTITGTSSAGQLIQTRARPGARLRVEITTEKGAPTVARTLTLRTARPGDASGRPLGC